ncbi:polyprenyl synthetase family protein [Kineosporia sp. J2-2]|uniref:Polyprenyl synthetase family protein n=1 Tax=Kineosporia corallincola TaxID=2835133 RepID=A0ABS5TLI7_9ACTN|nr:polyprenyl synthetase family protein [Kineosporia corallincola]MBT0771965.1 polyprenyl synthetase family protein [Kineosporia corallincola]
MTTGATTGDGLDREALDHLETARVRVEPALRAALGRLPGRVRPVALYHYGWSDAEGRECDTGRGKALRPALTLLSAAAAGGDGAGRDERVLAAAVAVDLVHNFSLVHDDVMDGDLTRRHRPTVWSVFGVGPAVLAGDALLTLALQTLAPAPAAAAAVADAVQELILGQIQDLALERRDSATLTECLAMAAAKTGALLGCSCALGALAAGAPDGRVRLLGRVGRDLGLAFQLTDDVLGIWGDPAVTGKPAGADLRARKKSLPVVAALASGTAAGRELARVYRSRQELGPDEVARAAALVREAGGRDWALERAGDLLGDIEKTLDTGDLDESGVPGLRSLARLCVDRRF